MSSRLAAYSPIRKPAFAACLLTILVSMVAADPPSIRSTPKVIVQPEMWNGLKRVDKGALPSEQPNAKPPQPKPIENPKPADWISGAAAPGPELINDKKAPAPVGNPLPLHSLVPFPKAPVQAAPINDSKIVIRTQENAGEKEQPSRVTPSPAPKDTPVSANRSTNQEAAAPPVNTGQHTPQNERTPQSERVSESNAPGLVSKTLLDVCVVFAVAIIVPLVSLTGLFLLLRRHAKLFGPLIRIEYTGTPMVVGPYTVNTPGLAGPGQPGDPSRFGKLLAEIEEATTAEQFDLGPTFEDERIRKEEQLKLQEEGMLQNLFEENLKLQEQLGLVKENEEEVPPEQAQG